MTQIQLNRQTIRQDMRAYRRSLSPAQQKTAAIALRKRLSLQPLFTRSKRIALYLANDGEIDPAPLLEWALSLGKECYLPALAPSSTNKDMWFIRYTHNTPMKRNRYGINEPRISAVKKIKPERLDLVLMPLVAFDESGGRLGMGGGYYDRCFAFKQTRPQHSPYLLGLAHDGQKCNELPLESWDIPLAAIATDERLLICDENSGKRNFK